MLTQLTLVGRLTADPELRFTSSGDPVANFTVACSRSKKRDDGTWETTAQDFNRCALWGSDAQAMVESGQFAKGTPVIALGEQSQVERDGKQYRNVTVRHIGRDLTAWRSSGGSQATSTGRVTTDSWGDTSSEAPF
ncbi:MAG: single-stranded DNA-binding protein [Candidatus Nanopelagicales bacterium]